jgi:hypothetical protein
MLKTFLKEPNRNSGDEKYSNWNNKLISEIQQQI